MREREFDSSRRDDSSFTAAVFIEYLTIVAVVIMPFTGELQSSCPLLTRGRASGLSRAFFVVSLELPLRLVPGLLQVFPDRCVLPRSLSPDPGNREEHDHGHGRHQPLDARVGFEVPS